MHLPALVATLALVAASCGVAWAQTAPAPSPARAAAKPAAAAKQAPAPTPAMPAADADQMTAAGMAYLGDYDCEFGEVVHVGHNHRHEGYIDVRHRTATWTMKPVLSRTGALRLEDVRGRILMLQIANKSMLMDTQAGRRLVDNCVHEKQRAAAAQPPQQSLGIAPARAASAPS